MSTDELKATARRAIEGAYNQGRLDGLDQLYTPNILYHRPPLVDIEGLGPLKEYIADLRRAFSHMRYTLDEIALDAAEEDLALHAQGDMVAVVGHPDSDVPLGLEDPRGRWAGSRHSNGAPLDR